MCVSYQSLVFVHAFVIPHSTAVLLHATAVSPTTPISYATPIPHTAAVLLNTTMVLLHATVHLS